MIPAEASEGPQERERIAEKNAPKIVEGGSSGCRRYRRRAGCQVKTVGELALNRK